MNGTQDEPNDTPGHDNGEALLRRADGAILRCIERPFLAAIVFLYPCYFAALTIGTDLPLAWVTWFAARNVLVLIPLALASRWLIIHRLVLLRPSLQLLAHGGLAICFSVLWYVALLVIISVRSGWQSEGFAVRPFDVDAGVWQLFQGVTLYALVAIGTQLVIVKRNREDPSAPDLTPEQATPPLANLLIQSDDSAFSLATRNIIRISGAGDYAEIFSSGAGRTRSRTRLAQFEDILSANQFIRAHRSHLINPEHIVEVEPAGNGRMTVHLSDGCSIVTSRAGAKLIRSKFR